MSQWTVEPVMPGWGILLIVLGLFGLLAIRPSFGGLGARQLLRLRLLRSGVIVLLAVGLVRPGCVRTIERPQRVVIPLAVDLSRSMELPHAGDSLSRWQKLQQTLRASQSQLNQLSERYDVKYFGFDGELIPLDNVQGLPQLPALPEGSQTDYGQALDAITRQMRGERMAAAFIFGDGVQNTAYPKVEMARVLREFGELQTPLITVPFGQAAEGDQIADIAMTNLPDQFAVFVKNELQIQGVVRVRG